MSKYTPGPWEAQDLDTDRLFPHVRIGPTLRYPDGSGMTRNFITINEGPSPEDVAKGEGFGTTMETCRANARLIAAAPDLLEALKAVVDWQNVDCEDRMCPGDDTCQCPIRAQVNAAIRKAEGR